jgi:hypothetical protein
MQVPKANRGKGTAKGEGPELRHHKKGACFCVCFLYCNDCGCGCRTDVFARCLRSTEYAETGRFKEGMRIGRTHFRLAARFHPAVWNLPTRPRLFPLSAVLRCFRSTLWLMHWPTATILNAITSHHIRIASHHNKTQVTTQHEPQRRTQVVPRPPELPSMVLVSDDLDFHSACLSQCHRGWPPFVVPRCCSLQSLLGGRCKRMAALLRRAPRLAPLLAPAHTSSTEYLQYFGFPDR